MKPDVFFVFVWFFCFYFIFKGSCKDIIFKDNFIGVETLFPCGKMKLYPDLSKWAFTFYPGIKWPESYGDGTNWLIGNAECQTYVTPFLTNIKGSYIPEALRYDPFTIKKDGLHIQAKVLSEEQLAAYKTESPYRMFGSGMLLLRKSFLYGKVRLIAKLPKAKGSWPQFWMLPANFQWPPEIDIFEAMPWGARKTQFHAGIIPRRDEGKPQGTWYDVNADLSEGFNEYGLDWGPETLTGFFNGKIIWSRKTPNSMNQEMHLIINYAIGGNWVFNELGLKPINSRCIERFTKGSKEIVSEFPDSLVLKSLIVTKENK